MSISHLPLREFQSDALKALKGRLQERPGILRLVLFGSAARGKLDRESDLDVLVLTSYPFTRQERHQITDIAFEINLAYGTNISTLVVNQESWEKGRVSVLPLHAAVEKEGVPL